MAHRTYVLDDDPDTEAFTLEDFLSNNEGLDDTEKDQVTNLKVGESYLLGGGAAAEFTIRRIA